MQDDKPTIYFGPHVEVRDDSPPPFYVYLNVHDKLIHNYLLGSGASHNVMPKVVMDELGLEITKVYHDFYSFDSKRVKCLDVIKDLVLSLVQLPMKSVVMDIVVDDICTKLGMMLSRSWMKKLSGTLQMDMSYATIPIFGGDYRRLYREGQLAYLISDHQNPNNHPIYAVEKDMESCVLHINDDFTYCIPIVDKLEIKINKNQD